AWTDSMVAGELPAEMAEAATTFLTRPDKNTLAWKAFEAAVAQLESTPEALLIQLGVWPHALALHQHRFLATHFPRGTGFGDVQAVSAQLDLPQAQVTAYSLDDGNTTEIDDALSVTPLD